MEKIVTVVTYVHWGEALLSRDWSKIKTQKAEMWGQTAHIAGFRSPASPGAKKGFLHTNRRVS